MDDLVGVTIQSLKDADMFDNSIIVFRFNKGTKRIVPVCVPFCAPFFVKKGTQDMILAQQHTQCYVPFQCPFFVFLLFCQL